MQASMHSQAPSIADALHHEKFKLPLNGAILVTFLKNQIEEMKANNFVLYKLLKKDTDSFDLSNCKDDG